MNRLSYDGLLADNTVPDLFFASMLGYRTGTYKEIFDKAFDVFYKENYELICRYTYDLEAFVNEYLRMNPNTQKISDAIRYGIKEYLWDCLQDNRFAILENITEAILYEYGFSEQSITRLNLLSFVDFQMYDTSIDIIGVNVKRVALTHIAP